MRCLTVISLCCIVFFSCRKEIDHVEGEYDLLEKSSLEGSWQIVSSDYTELKALTVYQNSLFLGGDFELPNGFEKIMRYDGSNFIPITNGNFYLYGVRCMEVINDKLYIGGRFSFLDWPYEYDNIIVYDGVSVSGYEFSGWSTVYGFTAYNDDIIVSGSFSSAEDKSDNISLISNEDLTKFYNDEGFGATVKSVIVYNNDLYAGTLDDYQEPLISKWNGASWNSMYAVNANWGDGVFDIEEYGGDLYACKNTNYGSEHHIMKLEGGTWVDIPGVQITGGTNNKFKVINGLLYLFGDKISYAGQYVSNVLVYNGSTWSFVGNFKQEVNDVTMFEGKLYMATEYGLYKFLEE